LVTWIVRESKPPTACLFLNLHRVESFRTHSPVFLLLTCMKFRPAASMIEMLIVVSIIVTITSLSIPLYRKYQVRNDLALSLNQVTQGLERARRNAQDNKNDTVWSFYIPRGELGPGDVYPFPDPLRVEKYPMPSTIAVNGFPLFVTYSRIEGTPHATGSIVLKSIEGDEGRISITVAVDKQIVASNPSEPVTICHYPTPYDPLTRYTLTVLSEAVAQTHYQHGDTFGPCPSQGSSSSSSSEASSSSSAPSGGDGSGISSLCMTSFIVDADKLITFQKSTAVTFRNLAAKITFGPGGPPVSMYVCYSRNPTASSPSFGGLYGANGNCKRTGNAYGIAVEPDGTDTTVNDFELNEKLALRVRGMYKKNGSLAFHEVYDSYPPSANDDHIDLYRNGDSLLSYPSFGQQETLKELLIRKGYFNENTDKVSIGACEILMVTEMSDPTSQSADFQDDVMLMTAP